MVAFSVVIPVHNEEDNIGPLLREILGCLKHYADYEIVCVDDNSTDASGAAIAAVARTTAVVRRISLRRQSGQSCALRKGVEAAHFPLIVSLDGDGQNDPADIPAFLSLYEEKNMPDCLLIGHRIRRRDTAWKKLSSRVANGVRSRILGDDTPDSGCGMKAFSRELFLRLPAFDHMHRFLPALTKRCGGSVFSVPVSHRPRRGGASHYGTFDRLGAGIVDVLGVMWLNHRVLPDPQQEERA